MVAYITGIERGGKNVFRYMTHIYAIYLMVIKAYMYAFYKS